MIIDSHQHFWDRSQTQFDYSWQEAKGLENICKTFLPSDLLPLLQNAGVDRTVVVQTQHDTAENHWALQLADENEFIVGVVGWVDLASDNCERQLLEFKDHPLFVGVRHVTQDEPDDDFIIRPDVGKGLSVLEKHGVPFDLLFYTKHLPHAATVADRFPNLPFVLNHLSKPEIKAGNIDNWRKDLAEAAKRENVWCKLSGLVTEADHANWKPSDLQPYVDAALESFTPDRLMFGSDWPPCNLAADYQRVIDSTRECIAQLSADEQAAIMGANAIKFYGLA